jgi:hypothetical protein
VRLEIVTLPDIIDRGLADSLGGSHQPATPVRHPFGLAAQCRIHNGVDFFLSVSHLAAAPWRYFPQTIQTFLLKARSPKHHRLAIGFQLCRDRIVRPPLCRRQHDAASQRHLLRCSKR